MAIEIITVDNYKFELELLPPQIKIKLTDTTSYDMYEGIVNEDDIYVKPIQKFYSMIIKSLNKEPNYNFKMNDKKTTLICTISYSTEMVDIDEHIKFIKLEDHKTKELLLLDEIRSLKEQVTNLEQLVEDLAEELDVNNILTFAYKRVDYQHASISDESRSISFNINNTELNFRPYINFQPYNGEIYYKSLDETNFNKFKKVTKIITNHITYLYHCERFRPHQGYMNSNTAFKIHNSDFIFMPNVTEIIIYFKPEDKSRRIPIKPLNLCEHIKINPFSFTNLEKIYYVNDGFIDNEINNSISLKQIFSFNFKKLKLISFQNFGGFSISNDDKLFVIAHDINLEII